MATITINGVDLTYSATSASFVRKTDAALNNMQIAIEEAQASQERGQLDYADTIERQALAFANVFDDIFGDGTANRMFGDVIDDVGETAKAVQKLIDFKREQENEFASGAQAYSNKYSPSRAVRNIKDRRGMAIVPPAIPVMGDRDN